MRGACLHAELINCKVEGNIEEYKKWKSIAEKLESENAESSPHFYPQFLWDEEISSK